MASSEAATTVTSKPTTLTQIAASMTPTQQQSASTSVSSSPPPGALTSTRRALGQPFLASFCAGGVAGAVSRTVVSPLERLKILFQVQSAGRTEYKLSVGKALAKMWREEGWRGFMAGNGTNCIRIVPYSAVQFGSYNLYKRFFEDVPGDNLAGSPFKRLLCGGLAGVTSVTMTYPLDIVRTRLSIQSASFADLAVQKTQGQKLPGMWTTLANMYKHEGGWTALYRGIIPTVAGVAPYVSLFRELLEPKGELTPRKGRPQLYGLRSGEAIRYAGRPERSEYSGQAPRRRSVRSHCANMHIPLVSDL